MIADRDREIATLQAQQTQARHASAAAKERFAVALLRERGALDLPAEALVALLSPLDVDGDATRDAVAAKAPPLQAEADDGPDKVAPAEANEVVAVTVRITRNVGRDKRGQLTAAGLRWNGRLARWVGQVDRRRHGELVVAFGDRVSITGVAGDAGPAVIPTAATGPDTPVGVPPVASSPATAGEARQAASDAAGGTFATEDGEAARAGSPAAEDRPPAPTPPRPRPPMRPMLARPGHQR
jgi:hypothetical protein